MAASGPNGRNSNLTFYPAYCFKASRTYFAWVKLTAFDIHNTLHIYSAFQGQNLYFYLNHPIQFVYLVGVVVSYEDFHEKRWLLIIDDSSGATIEVSCPKPEEKADKNPDQASKEGSELDGIRLAEVQARANTIASIDVGSVISVKGKIGTFRDTRQIHLERVAIVPDTNAELQFVEQRTKSKVEVLSKPWTMSSMEQRRLLKVAEGRCNTDKAQTRKRKERETARQAREIRHAERIAKKYEEDEVKRAAAAEIARKAGEMFMDHKSRKKVKSAVETSAMKVPRKL
ncbi:hypothetical protein GJ744_002809 [Endocarpon pusillum]|uniref:CST complex subunit STN1 n=1 Tax=Endocarpon pusillum TaxID=364733 RepID=A0A8H7E9V6_9EURO|nr:hypothetical protein GJ744_002809 [Endocarpon pusillum]